MENDCFCVGCGSKLLKRDKTMEYLGLVCSRCFRLSNARYIELVDRIAKRRFQWVLMEVQHAKDNMSPYVDSQAPQ
jgi:hypothetical protein